ncbi:MAG: c-type cytochrome [Nitrospirae bacterium]|nr:c-type cytochrome [Nitrospirota bacterium]
MLFILTPCANAGDPGKSVYTQRCMICHGPGGDGKGRVTALPRVAKFGKLFTILPRDFTTGSFKFRTTPTGCLPTDNDLLITIERGIQKAYMPSNAGLTQKELKAVVEYIKTFSSAWQDKPNETVCKPIIVKIPSYVGTHESIAKGEDLWKRKKCWECHGQDGRGDGPKADDLRDNGDNPILAYDFTSCVSKATFSPEKAYLAYTTGLNGTGMPSYQDTLNEHERWHLVSYTMKLMGKLRSIGK